MLRFSLDVAPGGMNIHPTTGRIDWLAPQTAAFGSPHQVTVVVSDDIAVDTQTFFIDVEEVNVAPMIYSVPVLEAAVGALYVYDVEASDLDLDPLEYVLIEGPDGMIIDEDTGLIQWTPLVGQDGDQAVVVEVSDPFWLTDAQSFTIDTAPCADAPQFVSTPRTTASPGVLYEYNVEAIVDSGEVSYELGVFPSGMTIDAASGVITWTPTAGQLGLHDVTVIAIRDDVCPSQQEFEIDVRECTISASYHQPVLVPGWPAVFVPITETNCGPLSFALLDGPEGMTVHPTSGMIHWVAVEGPYSVEVEVEDAWGTLENVLFAGEVLPETPPRIVSTPPFTAAVDVLYEYPVVAEDDEDDPIRYSLMAAPAGMQIDEDSGLVTWTPSSGQIGGHTVSIKADDQRGWYVVQTYTLTVSLTGTNHPPTILSTPPFTAAVGAEYVYQVDADDPDPDTLSFSLDTAPAGAAIDEATGELTWTPVLSQVGSQPFAVRVEDNQGGWALQTFGVTVSLSGDNRAPAITSTPVTTVAVGAPYAYAVVALDPDDDPVTYSLEAAPEGMTIHATTGLIQWTASAEQMGAHEVVAVASDNRGGSTRQAFTVTVSLFGDNRAPRIISTPVLRAAADAAYSYAVVAVDDDEDVLSFVLEVGPEGMSVDEATGLVTWTPSGAQLGTHEVCVRVEDPDGAAASQAFALTVSLDGTNRAPRITSSALTTVVAGTDYAYDVEAADDDEDVPAFTLEVAPMGMTIDPVSGLISWSPGEEEAGDHPVVVKASDPFGGWARQNYVLTVRINTPPEIVSQPITQAILDLPYVYAVRAVDADDFELAYSLETSPDGMTIDGQTGEISWTPTGEQTGDFEVVVVATDSLLATDTQAFTLTVHADANADIFPPEVSITVDPEMIDEGESVTISVEASDDFAVVALEVTVNGEVVLLDASNQAVYTASEADVYVVRAVATDIVGHSSSATADFFVRTPGDVDAPTIEITSPALDAALEAPTDFVGTVDDENLFKYTLAYRAVGQDGFTEFATGYEVVVDDVLGVLDTTAMANGMYDIRLRAFDTNGNVSTYMSACSVSGDLKIGHFAISFVDLAVPLSGMPITVKRIYDSREHGSGDFGHGWNLDVSSIELQENTPLGAEWDHHVSPGFGGINTYYLTPVRPPIVSVKWPDGRVDSFQMTLSPSSSVFIPMEFFSGVSFAPIPPTRASLRVIGDTSGYFDGGPPAGPGAPARGSLRFYSGALMDPGNYVLTAQDGTVYTFTAGGAAQISGLSNIADLNNNQLQILPHGIFHSSGVSIAFERDEAGRITTITDPEGEAIHYAYDERGDLIGVTDRADNTTEFTYNQDHYLLEVIDPQGNTPMRYVYDDDGRLIATVDAEGNRTELHHDPDANQEVITDALGNPTVHEYDAEGNITAIVNAQGKRVEYTYDDRGNELTYTDELGKTSTFTYDENNRRTSRTDPLDNTWSYTYNGHGKQLTATDPAGNVTSHEYDAGGNLIRTINGMGQVREFAVDGHGNRTSAVDPLGRVSSYAYDANGRLITETRPGGRTIQTTYDDNGNRLTVTETRTTPDGPEMIEESFGYDEMGRRTRATDAMGNSEYTEYDPNGRTTAKVDRLENRTEHEYDVRGRLVRTTYPDGTESTWTYDAQGNTTSATDRLGRTTTFAYDTLNRLTRTTFADDTYIERAYDDAGRVVRTLDERGHETVYAWDDAGRKLSQTDHLGNSVSFAYNELGQMTARTDPREKTTGYEYDELGRCVRTVRPDGTSTSDVYDAAGQRISGTDPAGQVTQFGYHASGALAGVTDALGLTTSYTYDEVGNLITQTDANSHATLFEYDKLGRRTKRTLPLGMEEIAGYDAAGNLTSLTTFNGDTIGFGHDADGRVTEKTLPGDTVVTYVYNASGTLQSVTDARGTTNYAYDLRDRLLLRTDPDGTQISYTYDDAGNRTSVTTADGTTSYTYDEVNRLATVTDPDGGISTYTYDGAGNREALTYPNGVRTNYVYDDMSRLTYMENVRVDGGEVISSYTYTLGDAGNRTRVVEHSGRTVDYAYDELYRLTRETIDDGAGGVTEIAYTYDAVGNRLSMVITTAVETTTVVYAYDDNDRLLSENRTRRLTGDPRGPEGTRLAGVGLRPNRSSGFMMGAFMTMTCSAFLMPLGLMGRRRRGVGRAAYYRGMRVRMIALLLVPVMLFGPDAVLATHTDALVQCVKAQTLAAMGFDRPENLTYTYDDNGNLLTRSDGTLTDTYVYDAENRMIEADLQLSSSAGHVSYAYDQMGIRIGKTLGGTSTTYLVDHNVMDARVLKAMEGTTGVQYFYGDDLIAMKREGLGTRYYLYDGHMSVRQLVDESGVVTDTYTYDAFGNQIAGDGTTPNEFRYAGEQYDANSGFYYLRARYYDPGVGRFTSMDTWEGFNFDPSSLHKYNYCQNDPVNHRDPSGNLTLLQRIVVIAIIAILVAITIQIWEHVTCGYFERVTDNSNVTMDNLPQTLITAYGGVFAANHAYANYFRDQYQSEYTSLKDDACGDAAAKAIAHVNTFDSWVFDRLTPDQRTRYGWRPKDAPDTFLVLPLRAEYASCYLTTLYPHQMASLTPQDSSLVSASEWVMLDSWMWAPVPLYDLATLRSASIGSAVKIGSQGGV